MKPKQSLASLAALLLAATCQLAVADEPNPAEAARRVAEGNRLLNEGKAAEALKEYDAALKANPEAPETAYNRGLALYKLKKFDEAGKAFQGAIRPGRPELEAKTKYNLGRSAHAAAIAAAESQQEDSDQTAIGELAKAIRYYDETLQLAPTDADAKLNRDLAERMIRYIERRVQKKKEENQNKQPSSQPSSQPGDQNQEQNPSSQPSSQPTSQPDQQDPSSQPSSQPSDSQQGEDKEGDKDKNDQDSKEGEQDDKNEEKSDPRARRNAGEQQEMRKMTKEEAERYLQQARDAEAKRRQLRRQWEIQQRGRIPVEKDW